MKKDKLKIAVIGIGHLGKEHARIYKELPEAEIIGLCDIDPSRKERADALGVLLVRVVLPLKAPRVSAEGGAIRGRQLSGGLLVAPTHFRPKPPGFLLAVLAWASMRSSTFDAKLATAAK